MAMPQHAALTLAILLIAPVAHAKDWVRADIYFLDWNVEVRARLSPEALRKQTKAEGGDRWYRIRHVSGAALNQLLDVLQLAKLRPDDRELEDARLVVDLFDSSGDRTTYYASRFKLATPDNRLKRAIDQHFRDYFRDATR